DLEKAMADEGIAPGSQEWKQVTSLRDAVLGAFEPNTKLKNPTLEMNGTSFQRMISQQSGLSRAGNQNNASASYAREIKRQLMDAASRTSTGQGTQKDKGRQLALKNFNEARRQWANMRAMEESASVAGEDAARGVLTPASLRQIATNRGRK